MNVTPTVKPPFGAVLLSEVWDHLRVDAEGSPAESPLDSTYERNILTATADFEKSTRTAVVEQTVRLSVGSVPECGIRLVRPPFQRIVSVSYYDGQNALQTVAPADYYVTDEFPPHLRFVTGWALPVMYERPDALRVDYVVGYEAEGSPPETRADYTANVPSDIKDAVLLRVEMLQANTSDQDRQALERAVESIESGHRVPLSQA